MNPLIVFSTNELHICAGVYRTLFQCFLVPKTSLNLNMIQSFRQPFIIVMWAHFHLDTELFYVNQTCILCTIH